ncbi:hypothetical protein LPY66_08400 [Dehalobacter sp. DCM]|uniref:hypothetical protein n=1 Tax=Dehalobacter sp. DCM TaxID=2907827 RepID=UPI003081DA60|nr:hypothetical protein LPY66_08400 [Dehalobacter sp. DCM]
MIKPESSYICQAIDSHNNNGYLFTFFHYQNRISLEIFHGICDGRGALEFLKTVVYHYFELLGFQVESENLVLTLDQEPTSVEIEDSYLKNFSLTGRKLDKMVRAYHTSGTRFPQEGLGVINGKVRTEQLRKLVKENKATISQYMVALLTHSIIQTGDIKRLCNMPVNICVPIDMRGYYHSKTLRNFFLFFRTSILCKEYKPSFEEILTKIKNQFSSELDRERLQKNLNLNVSLGKSTATKCCPLIIKWALIRLGHIIGSGIMTSTMSNLGNVVLPSSMNGLLENFEMNFDVADQYTHNLGIISCNGITTIGFTRCVYETELEKTFFSYLTDQGLEVEIQSNFWEGVV